MYRKKTRSFVLIVCIAVFLVLFHWIAHEKRDDNSDAPLANIQEDLTHRKRSIHVRLNKPANIRQCVDKAKIRLRNDSGKYFYNHDSNEIQTFIQANCKYFQKLCKSKDLVGRVGVDLNETSKIDLEELESLKMTQSGGWWIPDDCLPKIHVAIIIPFRNRESQLNIFLRHYHPIFQRQKLHYRIFVIEQIDQHPFNRGKLMNVGFNEALRHFPYHCMVFHDVDLLLEDDRLIYGCQSSPQHLSVGLDKYEYRLLYEELFGGIEMFSSQHFQLINGFSNSFWGWGAEDDNLYRRLRWKGLSLWRPPVHLAKYTMIKHKDLEAYASQSRFDIRKESYKHFASDGLSDLQYEVKEILQQFACTRIQVDLHKERDKLFGVMQFPE